jgi:hypothetical protein
MVKNYDYIIVGGGIAGIYLCYNIVKKCKTAKKTPTILLIEKEDYFGGRIKQINKKVNNIDYSFPAGAARFNKSHKETLNLLKEFKLFDTKLAISSDIKFTDVKNVFDKRFDGKDGFYYVDKVIQNAKKYSIDELEKYSFSDFAKKTLTKKELDFVLVACGYSGELKNMNMADATKLFLKGIRSDMTYYIGKFHILIQKMIDYLKTQKIVVHMKLREHLISIENDEKYHIKTNKSSYISPYLFLCIPKPALCNIDYLKPIYPILKKTITCNPLCRTYAIWKKENIWFSDLKDKIVTNNNLRYIIPMNNETGLIMISYTDDVYTKIWKKHENNENALKKIIVKLVKETFSINIESPEKVFVYHWDCGVAYWNKNVNSKSIHDYILNPCNNLFICGENYSLTQNWVEGALETCNYTLNNFPII